MSTEAWVDPGTLTGIAGIIVALGVAMLIFRIQRELRMQHSLEINWIPWADWLALGAAMLCFLLVLLPLLAAHPQSWAYRHLPAPACAASIILVAAYPLAILAHYQLILAFGRTLPRYNPEPSERWIVIFAIGAAAAVAAWVSVLHAL